jgi:general secretion pathway protein A
MSLMMDFYGLRERPFGVSPNPRFLYHSVQHREALDSLLLGIEDQAGFAALIAEPGTGKTTLLFDILLRYRDRASIAFVFNTQCSGQELLRHIALELQIPGSESEQDPVRLHWMFTSFVADRARTKPVVIIIDEAQNLSDSALEALRLLSNFEATDHKLMHIIIAGQPLLEEHLRGHTELLQRITTISRLNRLSPKQVEECIAHRLQIGGYSGPPLFTTEAMAKIASASAGTPREINRICMNALQLGFTLQQKVIRVEVIEAVLSELKLTRDPRTEASRPGGAQFEAAPRVTRIAPGASAIPVNAKASETPDEPWVLDQSVDLSLGDEVIDSVLSGLDPDVDSRTEASREFAGAQSEAGRRADPGVLNLSAKSTDFYPGADLGSDESIEAFLSELNLNGDPLAGASKESPKAEPRGLGIEPRTSSAPVEAGVTKAPIDTRVLKVFAAPRASTVRVEPVEPEVSGTIAVPGTFAELEERWATNVRIEQWAQGSLGQVESTDKPPAAATKTEEHAAKPSESEARNVHSGLSPKVVTLLCIALMAALLLFTLITTRTSSTPSQPVPVKPNTQHTSPW